MIGAKASMLVFLGPATFVKDLLLARYGQGMDAPPALTNGYASEGRAHLRVFDPEGRPVAYIHEKSQEIAERMQEIAERDRRLAQLEEELRRLRGV